MWALPPHLSISWYLGLMPSPLTRLCFRTSLSHVATFGRLFCNIPRRQLHDNMVFDFNWQLLVLMITNWYQMPAKPQNLYNYYINVQFHCCRQLEQCDNLVTAVYYWLLLLLSPPIPPFAAALSIIQPFASFSEPPCCVLLGTTTNKDKIYKIYLHWIKCYI